MNFAKWQACGNDFIFIDAFDKDIEPIVKKCKLLCDRHFGIGADGIIFILPSEKADLKMRIFNSDGSEAEMCGNGIRAFAKQAYEWGRVSKKQLSVETGAGILAPSIQTNGMVQVDMGTPRLKSSEIPVQGFSEDIVVKKQLFVEKLQKYFDITCVSMGNPHCVIFTHEVEKIDLPLIGPLIETNQHFPKKINTEFAELIGKNTIRMRVWERGAGITLACGTGACATVVAAIINGLSGNEADVVLDGGTLHISWEDKSDSHVFMTGPADKVFEGNF
jgi:hypothetical protein